MQIISPKKLYVIFGVFLIIGLYISIFIAFNQVIINQYIVLVFGISISFFGAKGIYRTIEIQKRKTEK